jgi:hypothetical protein
LFAVLLMVVRSLSVALDTECIAIAINVALTS